MTPNENAKAEPQPPSSTKLITSSTKPSRSAQPPKEKPTAAKRNKKMPEIDPTDTSEQRETERVALECPNCFSHRAEMLMTGRSVKACCLHCDTIYNVKYRRVSHDLDDAETPDQPPPLKRKKGKQQPTDEQPIVPAERPTPSELGPLTQYVTETVQGGAKALRAAQRQANRLARKFGLDFQAHWLLETSWLREWAEGKHPLTARQKPVETVNRCDRPSRLRVRAVIAARARFLTFYAVLGSQHGACKKARISFEDIAYQLKNDPDFMAQAEEAKEHAIDLLHTRCMQRCLEGDIEPVYWQGEVVGHIQKFDTRLQIEMLRGHMPYIFKTPGSGQVNVENGDNILVMTEELRAKLMAANRERIMALPDSIDFTPAGEPNVQRCTNDLPSPSDGAQ
jgi:hypothetical protein